MAIATCASTKAAIASVAPGEVRHVVDALAGAAEEAQRAVLGDVAARRDDRGAGHQLAHQRHELVLGAAGAVEDEDQRPALGPALGVVGVALGGDGSCQRLQMLSSHVAQVRVLLRQLQRLAEMRGVLVAVEARLVRSRPRRARRPGVRK